MRPRAAGEPLADRRLAVLAQPAAQGLLVLLPAALDRAPVFPSSCRHRRPLRRHPILGNLPDQPVEQVEELIIGHGVPFFAGLGLKWLPRYSRAAPRRAQTRRRAAIPRSSG